MRRNNTLFKSMAMSPGPFEGRQRGFSLLEAMVAAGVLSVGLLGLAGLQGMSLGKNVDAGEITRATNLATDITERIQNNRQRVMEYSGIDTAVACPATYTDPAPFGLGNIMAVGVGAQGDCNQWRTVVAASGLANARGVLTVERLDPSTTMNPQTLHRVRVIVNITWTTSIRNDVTAVRSKTATFFNIIAPE
ncbi:MAG TPA: type IV pilus modification protein PilV [Nitrospiraceae bacterium]|nr:type IV pilus modification protein PilV [Nitrospiraceae bacterium]